MTKKKQKIEIGTCHFLIQFSYNFKNKTTQNNIFFFFCFLPGGFHYKKEPDRKEGRVGVVRWREVECGEDDRGLAAW
jgi:CRISPR/Cas system CMR-associated protein Cmr1 (group 7 of RAMP superfamily)